MKTPEQVNVCLVAITGFAYFFKAAMLRKYASLDYSLEKSDGIQRCILAKELRD